MKNEILDEPIHNSFFDFSEKGEKILWEDHIKEQPLFSIIEMIPVVFLFLLFSLFNLFLSFLSLYLYLVFLF
jgi:hypothetical protein